MSSPPPNSETMGTGHFWSMTVFMRNAKTREKYNFWVVDLCFFCYWNFIDFLGIFDSETCWTTGDCSEYKRGAQDRENVCSSVHYPQPWCCLLVWSNLRAFVFFCMPRWLDLLGLVGKQADELWKTWGQENATNGSF